MRLKVVQNSENAFEVQSASESLDFRVVDINSFSCSCGLPQETALPCRHLCAALMYLQRDPRDTVLELMHAGTFARVYGGSINPVDTTTLEDDGLQPPSVRRGRGLPRIARIRPAIERANRRTVTCSRCGKPGHNTKTCASAGVQAAPDGPLSQPSHHSIE